MAKGLEQSAADAWLFECGILGRPQPIALELRGRMSAIDICDSDEDRNIVLAWWSMMVNGLRELS